MKESNNHWEDETLACCLPEDSIRKVIKITCPRNGTHNYVMKFDMIYNLFWIDGSIRNAYKFDRNDNIQEVYDMVSRLEKKHHRYADICTV